MDRESFLTRIRSGLGGTLEAPPADLPDSYRPPPPADESMTDRLTLELEAVGGVVHRVASPAAARATILALLAERGARRVIRGNTALLQTLELDDALEQTGLEVTVADPRDGTSAEALRDAAFAADAGITSADYGVAETGTLALLARPGQSRSTSLLPPMHVAVLDERTIVFELAALFAKVTADGVLPSALTLITGPSRTGDIELVLTVGVHGPGELHLILLETDSG